MRFRRWVCRWFGHEWIFIRNRGIMLSGIKGIVCTGRQERCIRCYNERITGNIR